MLQVFSLLASAVKKGEKDDSDEDEEKRGKEGGGESKEACETVSITGYYPSLLLIRSFCMQRQVMGWASLADDEGSLACVGWQMTWCHIQPCLDDGGLPWVGWQVAEQLYYFSLYEGSEVEIVREGALKVRRALSLSLALSSLC
jgi:hypothetical protein